MYNFLLTLFILLWLAYLRPKEKEPPLLSSHFTSISCGSVKKTSSNYFEIFIQTYLTSLPESGMVLIPGGQFEMGSEDSNAGPDEKPIHIVSIASFYMDITEVTNAQFKKFVDATGYVTTAERELSWVELSKQLPLGTPRPPDSLLLPSSLVFSPSNDPILLNDNSKWWKWVRGANWKHPQGPGSTIIGKESHPVVQISWDDAMAYCKWANKRLPTEAEWEYAARGGLVNTIYPWGKKPLQLGKSKMNSWDGSFPYYNSLQDGFYRTAPVRTYSPNGYGLYDMAGNVWEWCNDWYQYNYYDSLPSYSINPRGPTCSIDPDDPNGKKRVLRGGSFLCNDSYCSGYRVSRRMKSTHDTGLEHTGFRCAKSL